MRLFQTTFSVTEDGVMYSQYETSLKKAKQLRNEWVG